MEVLWQKISPNVHVSRVQDIRLDCQCDVREVFFIVVVIVFSPVTKQPETLTNLVLNQGMKGAKVK